jgi:short-subunit dehydrogenase
MLVTGASSGIGWALAIRAARAGYAVYAVGRNREALDALRVKIENESGFVAVDATDIAVSANARGLVERALAWFGSIDVLVNNAGYVSAGPLSEQRDDELQRQFGTHVLGPVALVREARAALRAARGHVFMLGSGVARVPVGGLGAYPPAKAALRSATAILRRELAPQGIAVTYVDPGAVDTPFMTRAGMPGAPARILVSPEAVARKILIAVADRPRVLNAVAWQTAAVGLAELFPRLTDILLERAPALIGGNEQAGNALGGDVLPLRGLRGESPEAAPAPASEPEDSQPAIVSSVGGPKGEPGSDPTATPEISLTALLPDSISAPPAGPIAAPDAHSFEGALEPHRRRMEKLNFRESFVRELLVVDARLDLGDIALRWAGMPNKNERAITHEVLEALMQAGFLERSDGGTYRVLKTP